MAWDYPSHHGLLLKEGVRPFNTATPAAFSASRKPLKDILPSCSATFLQLTSHPSGDHHLIVQEAKEERPSFKEEGGSGRDVDPIGLKLGKRTYFEDSSSFATNHSNSNGTTNTNNKTGGRASKPSARCQVEGCKADLSTAKDYHRRHKVCDLHSKSASAVVSGIEQRFCQQCSRFHVVSEFDEGKRSCRRRLASHNERRRKPKMDPLTMRLPALQNDACFSQFFLPRNSLPYPSYPKTSSSPPFWEVSEQSKGYWPNSWNTGNDTLLATEMGRQLFQQGNNMLFFSSPNVISTKRGFQGLESSSSDLVGEGLSLCSPSGSIAFSPLETTTTGTTKTTTSSTSSIPARHSNSGCALSLLSLLQPATSLDLCMHSDMSAYQSLQVNEPSASSQVFIGGHHFGLDSDRMQKIGFDSDSDQMWKIGFDSDRMQQVGFDSDRMRQIGLEESDRMRQIGMDSNRMRQIGLDSNRMRQIGLDPNDGMRQMGLDSNDGMRQMGLDPDDGMRQMGLDPDDGMRQIGLDSDANRMRQIGLDSDDRMQQIGLDSDDPMRQIGFDSDSIRQIGLDSDFDRMRQIGLDSDWMRQIASDSNRTRQIKHGRDENRTIDLMHVVPFSSRSSYDQSYLHTPLQGGRSQLSPNQYSDVHGLRSYGTFSI